MTSKVTMPEPVAYRSKESPYLFILGGPEADGFEGLITTDQAEAYANAMVKQALEEAIIEVMRCKTSGIIRNDTVDKCADAIRALIPKEPPCET